VQSLSGKALGSPGTREWKGHQPLQFQIPKSKNAILLVEKDWKKKSSKDQNKNPESTGAPGIICREHDAGA